MSINIQTVADKTIYENYFQDTITFPINSQIALTKCNMEVPVFVQNVLKVPDIPPGAYNSTILDINIDGLVKTLTFQDLYDAWRSLTLLIEPGLNIATFYSGNYEIFTNNQLNLRTQPSAPLNDAERPTFSRCLAKAIDREFAYYDCKDVSNHRTSAVEVGSTFGDTLVGNAGHIYNDTYLRTNYKPEISLNIAYNPQPIAETVPTLAVFDVAEVVGWTAGGGFLQNASGGVCFASPDFEIDNNGGYLRFVPKVHLAASSLMAVGFNLSGFNENDKGLIRPPPSMTLPADLNLIDIGVIFQTDITGTVIYYSIIDGTFNDGATKRINQTPPQSLKNFTNDSQKFHIQMVKSDMNNADGNIVFRLYQGSSDTPLPENFIYQFKTMMTSSSQGVNPLFLCDSNPHEVKSINYVPMTNDTHFQNNSGNFTWGRNDSFGIAVSFLNYDTNELHDFFAALGIDTDINLSPIPSIEPNFSQITQEGNRFNKTLSWKTNYTNDDSTDTNQSIYFIGKRNTADFFTYSADPITGVNRWVVNRVNGTATLPKELSVFVNNLDVKNYQGSFISLSGAETQTGVTRLVSTVPLRSGTNVLASENLTIEYETFNPYYRPISNPNNFTINQLHIEISYKDFATDQRKTIDNINGLVRCEFNIRAGAQSKKKLNNELLPYI